MKKGLAFLMAAFLTLTLAACGNGSSTASGSASTDGDTLLLGVFEPETGEYGTAGTRETLGIAYAHALRPTVTVDGVSYQVILDRQDSQSDQAAAVTAAERLVSDDCTAVIGSCDKDACLTAGNIFSDAQLPALSPSCTESNVTLGNDYYFRTCQQNESQGAALADWASAQDYKEVATVNSLDDPYTSSLVAAFTAQFEKNGGKVVAAETFPSGTTNFDTVLDGLKESGAKAVFAPTDAGSAVCLLNQAANQELKVQWIAGDTWNTPSLLEETGKNAEGVVLSCAYAAGANEDFDQGFQAWLEADPDRLEANQGGSGIAASQALAYDSYNTLLDAIEAAGSLDGPAIRDALAALKKTDGVTGTLSFDRNGDAVRSTSYLVTVKDGAFTFVDTIPSKK